MSEDWREVEPGEELEGYMECEFCHTVVPVSKWWSHDCKTPAVPPVHEEESE